MASATPFAETATERESPVLCLLACVLPRRCREYHEFDAPDFPRSCFPGQEDREKRIVEGKTLQVVSRKGLAKMKQAAGRPQDLNDLSQLGIDK
jgi:hypothetical protein